MTNEQHIENLKKLKSFHNGSYGADIDRAIKALEQACEDAISRQAVIDACEQSINIIEAVDRIMDLPSVTPQPKTGKWIYKKDLKQFFCNKCGYPSLTDDDKYIYSMDLPHFCENCGAKMVVPQESEG